MINVFILAPSPAAALVHFTQGGPYFEEYRDCEYADAWRAERNRMLAVAETRNSKPETPDFKL